MKTNRVSSVAAPIVVEGLSKRYSTIRAVDDLSFAVGLARPTAGRALIYGSPVTLAAADACMLGVHFEPCGAHPVARPAYGRPPRRHQQPLRTSWPHVLDRKEKMTNGTASTARR